MLLLLFRGGSSPQPPYTYTRSQRTLDVRAERRTAAIPKQLRGVRVTSPGRGTTLLN